MFKLVQVPETFGAPDILVSSARSDHRSSVDAGMQPEFLLDVLC